MRTKLYLLLFLMIGYYNGMGQSAIELTAIKYSNYSGKTLAFLEMPDVSSQLIKTLDSLSRKYLNQPMVAGNNLKIFKEEPQEVYSKLDDTKIEKLNKNSTASFVLAINELPLNALLQFKDLDSAFIAQLLQKQSVAYVQFTGTLTNANGKTIQTKLLNVVLSRNKKTVLIGFLHPEYLLTPKSFSKLMDACMPILIDSTNGTEFLQMTSVPAIMADNFIQQNMINSPKLPTNFNKGIIQYSRNHQLQYLRYQAPGYEPIILKGKKQTPIPKDLMDSIYAYQLREPLFLREESRDILADKNYLLQCVVNVEAQGPFANPIIHINKKTGLPFHFLPGQSHVFMQDKDTIAIFSVVVNKQYPTKKRFYHQLYHQTDSSIITVSNNSKEKLQVYEYELAGSLKSQPFQILNSGMIGSTEVIREIFYKNQLVCIVQGKEYPELIAVIDDSIDAITLNQLLILSFSSLF